MNFGSPKCPCVGLDNITGVTVVVVNGTTKVNYPADLGARCMAWDDGVEPLSCMEGQSPGLGAGWCAQQWCFVDPCNCDIDVKPKTSSYLPDGLYQGKRLFYSYATCGGLDTWNQEQEVQMAEANESHCDEQPSESVWGKNDCKCIGINGEPGLTKVHLSSGHLADFPADTGTKCHAWEFANHPNCTADAQDIPSWCAKRWCYVDPCSCSLDTPPKLSAYLPEASFEGHPIYYSYATCDEEDSWTASEHPEACVNQKSESDCKANEKCGWDTAKEKCLGKELLSTCAGGWQNTTAYNGSVKTEKTVKPHAPSPNFGASKCPCVGLDNISGVTDVIISSKVKAQYPASLGSRCEAWDDDMEPLSCKDGKDPGTGNGWCSQQWCYVDPCNCDIETKPKQSSYLPDGAYQGKPLYYSYATCGGIDTWNDQQEVKMPEADDSMCKGIEGETTWGKAECRCIGIGGQSGSTNVTINKTQVAYPADTGTECKTWDLINHPACSGNKTEIPDWCEKRWCYVDPCSCSLDTPPKISSYLPEATFSGRTIYYSYDTCGSSDTWTAANHKSACVNQVSNESCSALPKCAWTEAGKCLGKDFVDELQACPVKSFAARTRSFWMSSSIFVLLLLLR
eukprot:TRINITY_DN1394_c0_g1_i6.p1 TRINITY_DN1394_c0_g1~~TRINITY_DN1394_c0_g1_i6.p1  ORF type:complete len:624 (+),score=112.37 TRINITY_DN1394_c0_g1_i6:925-2796(+)